MIKKNLKTLIITSIVILLPILAGIYLWEQLPEQLPYHWNASGEVDGWCGKPIAVFGMPFLLVAIQWICALGTAADPKKANEKLKWQATRTLTDMCRDAWNWQKQNPFGYHGDENK